MKKLMSLGVLLSVLTVIGCTNKEAAIQNNNKAIAVQISKSGVSSNGSFATASGKLVAKNSVNVSTRMMGYITGLKATVGQNVRAGELLVSINNTDIQAKGGQVNAQIAQAQANYNIAKKDYDRFSNLFSTQSASQKELDDMSTRYEMAKAGLDAVKMMKNEVNAQNRYANITAPISGVITATYVEQGDMASPGMPLLTIESPSVLQAQVLVSEAVIPFIKQGQAVTAVIKNTNAEVPGTVTEISLSSTNTGGQYMVKVSLSSNTNLLPGMFVHVQFPINKTSNSPSTIQQSVTVPLTALVYNGQLTGIYTVANNTALLRWVTVGKTLGDQVEILSGLQADEPFITASDSKLYNGAPVTKK